MRVVFLDVDGVLNRHGFRPVGSRGLVSWIEPELAARVAREVAALDARIVLASDWRLGRTVAALREALGVHGLALHDVTPSACGGGRWREIAAWLAAHAVGTHEAAIIDDAFDMGELAARHVRCTAVSGFDESAARALRALF
ncbi:MAG TPA: HAD domain-containing protein [Kofleriaceae bacterium]|nr:HAD domain-containing protein [Kofleriaceae bacterium]